MFLIPLREALEENYESSSESNSESEESSEEDKSSSDSESNEDEDLGYTEDDVFQIFSHLETIFNLSNVLIGLLEERYHF